MQCADGLACAKPKKWSGFFPRILSLKAKRRGKYVLQNTSTDKHVPSHFLAYGADPSPHITTAATHADPSMAPTTSNAVVKSIAHPWSTLSTRWTSKQDDERLRLHLDQFSRVLDQEGILLFSEPVRRTPVLTICHGFLDAELAALSMPTAREWRFKTSMCALDPQTQENYSRLFASQYPLEPLVDGLPESVWLQCVEPSLGILKSLSLLRRRKSNLGLRKAVVGVMDSNPSCRGDSLVIPLGLQPAMEARLAVLRRIQFLAPEGALAQPPPPEEDLEEEQENPGPSVSEAISRPVSQRRLRMPQTRPYQVLQELLDEIRQMTTPLPQPVEPEFEAL